MMKKVLIVEDESIVALEIASYVKSLGYEVVATASNANDAVRLASEKEPDAILMDVRLKGEEDGISATKRIIQEKQVSVIYITAFSDDESIERAIETNPAAYLTKPFNRKELAAALKIAIKRTTLQGNYALVGGLKISEEFSFDFESRQLICCGEYIHLTRKEQEFLTLLLEAKKGIVDIYTIENRIWPDKIPNENTRRGLVLRLRSKLKHQFIETVSGQGYRLVYTS